MNVLIVLTSHDRLGDTGEKTGFGLEELAAPYYRLKDAGVDGLPITGQNPASSEGVADALLKSLAGT